MDETKQSAGRQTPPLVGLIEWHTGGHHLSWLCAFCRAWLELGCEVAAFYPEPEAVKKYLSTFVAPALLQRLRVIELKVPPTPRIRPVRLRPVLQGWRFGKNFGRALSETERAAGKPFDLVFYMALFGWEESVVRRLIQAKQRPWAGLVFAARAPGTPAGVTLADLFRHPGARAIAVLDEEFAPEVAQKLQKRVVVLPDSTDESWEPDHPLERRFRRFAGEDKLVLIIGHLRPDKGVGTLAQLATESSNDGLAFAFVGEVDWWMDAKNRVLLEKALEAAPRAIFHLRRVSEELQYNAIVRAADVIFAAYTDFPNSSGTLAKAAAFEKPIIVSDGHLMAKRVREYRMGEIVPQNDPEATRAAIRRITDNYPAWLAEKRPRWRDYRALHSHETLVREFPKFLSSTGTVV